MTAPFDLPDPRFAASSGRIDGVEGKTAGEWTDSHDAAFMKVDPGDEG